MGYKVATWEISPGPVAVPRDEEPPSPPLTPSRPAVTVEERPTDSTEGALDEPLVRPSEEV